MRIIPLLIVVVFLGLLVMGIKSQRPAPYSKPVSRQLPEFSLPLLYDQKEQLSHEDLKGHYSLLNVFASWCYTCRLEHDTLLTLAAENNIPIYGIAWKDKPTNTRQWVENLGNPYEKIASDYEGELVVALGVKGTPETFLINPEGVVIYHHQGMLTDALLKHEILSLVKE